MVDLVVIALLVGTIYAWVVLGASLSFRVMDFPDLTMEGSFVLGGIAAWWVTSLWPSPLGGLVSLGAAFAAGALAGILTAALHLAVRVGPLLSGILVASLLYSLNLRLLLGRSSQRIAPEASVFSGFQDTSSKVLFLIILALVSIVIIRWLLSTRWGMLLRGYGEDRGFSVRLGESPGALVMTGLALSNGLIGVGGALLAHHRLVVAQDLVGGLLVTSLASIMIGEAVIRPKAVSRYPFAVLFGAILYSLVVTFALYDWTPNWSKWIQATDVRLITAALLIAIYAATRRHTPRLFGAKW